MKSIIKMAKWIYYPIFALLLFGLSNILMGGSVYVIANLNSTPPIVNSYDIQGAGSQLLYQTTVGVQTSWTPVGMAIDTVSKTIFVTSEFSSVIDLLDAQYMTNKGSTSAPNANDLAGIVYDHGNSILYAVDRGTNHLYVYNWNPTTNTLTLIGGNYISLPGTATAYGLALDYLNDILYVGDATSSGVKYYNISNLTTLAGSINVSHSPTGIAIDVPNQIIYTGAGYPYGPTTFSQYFLNNSTESFVDLGSPVLGIAVNQLTGNIYMTFYGTGGPYQDNLIVMDQSLNVTWLSGDIGEPSGLCIAEGAGYNPLSLQKTDNLGGGCVDAGSNISYTISYNNGNPTGVTGVVVTDQLSSNVTFVSCSGGGVYNSSTHTITWTVGPVGGNTGTSYSLVVTVNSGTSVLNNCSIESNETGTSTVTISTDVCTAPQQVPLSNAGIIISVFLIGMVLWFGKGRFLS